MASSNTTDKKETPIPQVESITIRTIIQLFIAQFQNPNPKQLTTLHQLTRTLAKRFKEQDTLKKLDRLNDDVYNCGYSLSILELAYFRDTNLGASTSKTYNYKGKAGRKIRLSEIIILCDKVKAELFDTFTEITTKHDLPFSPEGLISSTGTVDMEAL